MPGSAFSRRRAAVLMLAVPVLTALAGCGGDRGGHPAAMESDEARALEEAAAMAATPRPGDAPPPTEMPT